MRTHCVDGFEREVYLVNGQQPGPLIDVEEGDDVEVHVKNELMVDTAIHWHGQSLLFFVASSDSTVVVL